MSVAGPLRATTAEDVGAARLGSSGAAWVMNAFHIDAGNDPPVILFMGELSSLPIQTPTTRELSKPMNQAS